MAEECDRQHSENFGKVKRQDRVQTHVGDDHFLVIWSEGDTMRLFHSGAGLPVNFPAWRNVAAVVDAVYADVGSFRFGQFARGHLRDHNPSTLRLNFDLPYSVHACPWSADDTKGLSFAAGHSIENQQSLAVVAIGAAVTGFVLLSEDGAG